METQKASFISLSLGFVLSACVCLAASAETWYVDGTLAQSGNGKSWDTAFKTIQEGIDASSHGDTAIAARAVYLEKIAFKSKNIVLRSLDPLDPDVVSSTMIIGTPAPGSVVTFSGTENDKCVLAGFAIMGGEAISGGGGDQRRYRAGKDPCDYPQQYHCQQQS